MTTPFKLTDGFQNMLQKCFYNGPAPKLLNGYTPKNKLVTELHVIIGQKSMFDISPHGDGCISK